MSTHKLDLLPPEALVATSEVDHARWNYSGVVSYIQRTRFRLALSLLADIRCERLLEIGYGSGVFMPELKRHCEELFGIDPHERSSEVAQSLAGHGVTARLFQGPAQEMPFDDDSFDVVVVVSALEYVEALDQACEEVKRVLRPGGKFIVITPGHSPLLDVGLKLLTGESAEQNYGNRRKSLQPALTSHFAIDKRLDFPRLGGRLVRLYTALRLTPKS